MNRFTLTILLFLSTSTFAQEIQNNSELEIKEIMKGDVFIGHQPSNIRWDINGKHILFDWNPENNPGESLYSYSIDSKKTHKVTPDFFNKNSEQLQSSQSKITYFTENRNLIKYDFKREEKSVVFASNSSIYNVQEFKEVVYFEYNSGLYKLCKADGNILQVVEFKKGEEPSTSESKLNLMEEEELELFQFHQDNKERKDWRKSQNETWSTSIKSIYFQKGSINNIQATADGRYVLFRTDIYPDLPKTHVEHHISADGYSYSQNARAKVSDEDATHTLSIYDNNRDTVYLVDFSTLKDIRKKPAYLADYNNTGTYEEDRKIIMHELQFSSDGTKNIMDIRSYDNKDRWIVSVDFENGTVNLLEHQHDEAWIGGPGISSWNMAQGTLGWLNDNKSVYFQSEESGYSHLYILNTETKVKSQLTSGEWEVHNVQLNKAGTSFFIQANKTHPGNRDFYHLSINDRKLTPILTANGNHEVVVSPDEKTLAIRYSYKNKPWEIYFAPNKANTQLTKITSSTTDSFNKYKWYDPEVITFNAEDGKTIHARVYSPEASAKNGAAVIFVHGAGYLQNAHNFWSGYHREYMFHNLLRDNGFTVLDIDYRASKGYGRDHRTGIYRHMGGLDLSDQLDGKQYLIDSLGIDPNRVGMYGGSYGGFITLMALLTEPEEFKAGAAIRSVTDWSHYNHEYTSNILNYPGTDPEAYKKSSPIYFAENLQDNLLMLHGMVDDNVQFQDVVRLSQRFIELDKSNWELAVYPVEAHGFKKASSWNDEYRRIYELFYEELILKK